MIPAIPTSRRTFSLESIFFFSRAGYLDLIFSLLGSPLNKYIRPLNTVTSLLRAVTQQQTKAHQMISKVLHAFLTLRF